MDSNIPSCGMGTTIVQMHDFVPIFLKNFLGEDPQTPPPPLPGISKGMFW